MDPHSSDACPPPAALVVSAAGTPSLAAPSSAVAPHLYAVDQFGCSLPGQHCLPQCTSVEPPPFQLHLPRPPQVQPIQNYPQQSAAAGLGMLYNPAVSPLVKREPRTTRELGPGVVPGWHTMTPVGYRDRRLVQPITPVRNSSTPASSQLQHQHEINSRNITNNNHENTSERKKSRRSGKWRADQFSNCGGPEWPRPLGSAANRQCIFQDLEFGGGCQYDSGEGSVNIY